MPTHAPHDSHLEEERAAHVSAARYWIVWVLLLIGTFLTFGASRIDFPPALHLWVALGIACAKSALVVMFFMHLYDHAGASRIVFITSVFMVVLLIGLVVLDNATRYELTNPGRGRTLDLEPPGPDLLTPRGPPEPTHRSDLPVPLEPGKDVGIPEAPPAR